MGARRPSRSDHEDILWLNPNVLCILSGTHNVSHSNGWRGCLSILLLVKKNLELYRLAGVEGTWMLLWNAKQWMVRGPIRVSSCLSEEHAEVGWAVGPTRPPMLASDFPTGLPAPLPGYRAPYPVRSLSAAGWRDWMGRARAAWGPVPPVPIPGWRGRFGRARCVCLTELCDWGGSEACVADFTGPYLHDWRAVLGTDTWGWRCGPVSVPQLLRFVRESRHRTGPGGPDPTLRRICLVRWRELEGVVRPSEGVIRPRPSRSLLRF